ncbi:MAG: chorismate-binding protein [Candidatus Tumulicola sp.]
MDDARFRVVVGVDPAQVFERPLEVLRAHTRAAAEAALTRAQEALSSGAWIAGFLSYELGAALAGCKPEESRLDEFGTRPALPLLCLGVFEKPHDEQLPADSAAGRLSPLLGSVTREGYDAAIATIQREIRDGNVYQVNYTVPFALHAGGDLAALYAFYARRSHARYQAYVEDAERAILSWSPEVFLAFEGSRIVTKPMKGTAPPDRPFDLKSDKNRAEHLMIVDLLRNDLHRICDDVDAERLFTVERFPTFATMTSTIAGTLRPGSSLLDVFRATFPCGSVTGAPKRAAMSFIARHEVRPRGVYCGSVGFLSPDRRGWWNVAIRTAQLDCTSGLGTYDAGGGIVADSSANDEWAEVRLKSRFLRDARNDAFAVLETLGADADDATAAAHLARLERSAAAFGIAFDFASVSLALRAARLDAGGLIRVRLGLDGSFSIKTEPRADVPPAILRVCFDAGRVWSRDPFLRHKTSWRPAHDAAAKRADALACFDGLLQNERGELTEGARTNLFVESEGTLWTPPLAAGLLPGILRNRIVSDGQAHERVITPEHVRAADAVYVGNSARGLLRVELFEEARR